MEIGGIPVHPLVIHGAVVVTPVAALAAIVFAVVSRWRWLTRWPALLLAAGAAGAVYLAKLSGESLLEQRPELLTSPDLAEQIQLHQDRGDQLLWMTLGFLVVVAAAAWTLSSATPLPSGRGGRENTLPIADKVLPALVVVVSVAVLVQVILTGDAGSRAVWG